MSEYISRAEIYKLFPQHGKAYLHYGYIPTFDRMLTERRRRGLPAVWQTGRDVFNWWMEYDVLPGQIDLFEEVQHEAD